MDAPNCRLCGGKHYGLCDTAKAAVAARQKPQGFDRNAYQAEYMRDQRKASKLGLTVKEWRAKGKPTK